MSVYATLGKWGLKRQHRGFAAPSSVCPPRVTDCIIQLQDGRKDLQYLEGLQSLCKQPLRRCQISGIRAHVKHVFNDYFYRYRRYSFLTRNALMTSTGQQMMSLQKKRSVRSHTAIDVGSAHWSHAEKSCTMHTAQKLRGQSAQSAAHPL